MSTTGLWTPPQYSKPPLYSIVISGSPNNLTASQATSVTDGVPTFAGSGNTTQLYVFQAVLSAQHSQEQEITTHPVQTGANIADHAFAQPAQITMEIGMSDMMVTFASVNQPNADGSAGTGIAAATEWTGDSASVSVNAYQTLVRWARERVLMTLNTRLRSYPNVLVKSVSPTEDSKTRYGLRCSVTFQQVFIASTQQTTDSARADATTTTNAGTASTTPPTATQEAQYGGYQPVASHATTAVAPVASHLVTTPTGGTWSSISNSVLQSIGSVAAISGGH